MTSKLQAPKHGHFVEAQGMLRDQVAFLAKAVSDDETRYFMQHIEIEEVEPATAEREYPILRGIATDGRRIHIVDPLFDSAACIFGMSAGRYDVVSVKAKAVQIARLNAPEGSFPNWRKVLPEELAESKTQFDGFNLSASMLRKTMPHMAKLFRWLKRDCAINLKYLADLGEHSWQVEQFAKSEAIRFTSNCMTAVIMPITLENY